MCGGVCRTQPREGCVCPETSELQEQEAPNWAKRKEVWGCLPSGAPGTQPGAPPQVRAEWTARARVRRRPQDMRGSWASCTLGWGFACCP